jgi:hypothetical protein
MEPTQQQMWGWFVGAVPRHRQVQKALLQSSLPTGALPATNRCWPTKQGGPATGHSLPRQARQVFFC